MENSHWMEKKDDVVITVHDDNVAMIQVMKTEKNPTMRGLGNTHGVSINSLKEAFDEDWTNFVKEDTNTMAGDIFTKAFDSKDKWTHACNLINIFDMKLIKYAPRVAGGIATQKESQTKKGSNAKDAFEQFALAGEVSDFTSKGRLP